MKRNRSIIKLVIVTSFSTLVALNASETLAAGLHGGGHGRDPVIIGKAGKASNATRTVKVMMQDNYYDIENLSIKGGETIRFVIKNTGEFVHEFNIGTKAMHKAHHKEMVMMMEHGALEPDKINQDKMKMDMGNGKTMQHNDPNSVLLEPGKSAEIIWEFPKKTSSQIEFACNIPGHYEAGMVGKVRFKKFSS